MKKNLVIGSGRGYSWYAFEPFVRSFIKYVKNADLVLFVEDISDFTRQMLQDVGKEIKGGELKLESFSKGCKIGMPVNERWKMFLQYVELNGSRYEQIFVADIRDIFFQGDIFECFLGQKNFLAYAAEAGTINDKTTGFDLNHTWHQNCFGKEVADRLADKDIICGGTTIATAEEMKIFLQKLLEYMPKGLDFHGVDQATYQYIVHNNLLPIKNIIKCDCWKSAILTSFLFSEYNFIEIKDNMVLRGDGGIPAVVHQYDRLDYIVEFVDKNYRDLNFYVNDKFHDFKSFLDQMPHLINTGSFADALHIFVKHLANNEALKEHGDELIIFWDMLTKNQNTNSFSDILGVALQQSIRNVFEENLYIIRCKNVCKCLKQCQKNCYTLVGGFVDWVKGRILHAAKWHLAHNNAMRYVACINLMIEMNLTNNEIFWLLMAETFRDNGRIFESRECYKNNPSYQDSDKFKRAQLLTAYQKKLFDDLKITKGKIVRVIKPNKNNEESDLVFDEITESFVKVKKS